MSMFGDAKKLTLKKTATDTKKWITDEQVRDIVSTTNMTWNVTTDRQILKK
jgi:hypothetical protein